MSKLKIGLFIMYILMLIGAIISYGFWLGSNNGLCISSENFHNEVFNLIMVILIGYIFLFSIYYFIVFGSVTIPGSVNFVMFIIVTIMALTTNTIYYTTESDPNVFNINGILSRNWMMGLGLSSIVPLLGLVIIDLLDKVPESE